MPNNQIDVIGFGHLIPEGLSTDRYSTLDTVIDAKSVLKDKKSLKLLSKQDALALVAAYRAWSAAAIEDDDYADKTGIYFCSGILPFDLTPLNKALYLSQENGKFSLQRFSTESYQSINPLLTFKCLPNMPLFHISYNLGITGRYFITYPGIQEWFAALLQAIEDLEHGLVEYALVGAVADQKNYLVIHHVKRINPALAEKLVDAASVLVLQKSHAPKALAQITKVETSYSPFDPIAEMELLISDQGYFPLHVGVVEAALYCSLHLEKRREGTLRYTWQGTKDCCCLLEMEIF